ncbi:hypothetical protein JS533_008975 [Bifidobacterium amazonense]|uniref:Transposase n=1 Tax=Bifidobacterium amazonense TaxID=2809027 RepID=A0ABS9VWU7_9BIFI|nr:hypothetical protein [Bifidobacterium amazonense]MCH9276396.1 hypothetical protein [Bifidobacterium amazonense]
MRLKASVPLVEPDSWDDPMPVRRRDGSPLAPGAISLDMTYIEAAGVGAHAADASPLGRLR